MRNTAAAVLGLSVRGFGLAVSRLRGSSAAKLGLFAGPVAVLVAGLLVGLPAKPVAAQAVPTFAPLVPQGQALAEDSSLPLDVPFKVQFTRPMNEGTVAAALTITPQIDVNLLWNATGQVLSLAPDPYWQPHTLYTVDISGSATDQSGLGLAQPIYASFESGAQTSGRITATKLVGGLAAPSTAFQITFTRPVKLATVILRLYLNPPTPVSITGDDPTDEASQVFTITPKNALLTNTAYQVVLNGGGTDSAGASLQPVTTLTVTTLQTPAVVKITPQEQAVVYDTNQPISGQFSVAMDQKATASALTVLANSRAVTGSITWTDDGTTMVFAPRHSFLPGSRISVRVGLAARSAGGEPMAAAVGTMFTVSAPRSRIYASGGTKIPWTGGVASSSSPWHDAELYYLSLMNCTRTGGWVTSSGSCSTQTHHTLPARAALAYSVAISNKVSRPYAKALADLGVLTHYLYGTTTHSRLAAAGFPGASWGENIASPGNPRAGGMISIEIYFQNEYWCRCGHYFNIMDPYFHQAGVGVWVSSGRTRVVVDFYG